MRKTCIANYINKTECKISMGLSMQIFMNLLKRTHPSDLSYFCLKCTCMISMHIRMAEPQCNRKINESMVKTSEINLMTIWLVSLRTFMGIFHQVYPILRPNFLATSRNDISSTCLGSQQVILYFFEKICLTYAL